MRASGGSRIKSAATRERRPRVEPSAGWFSAYLPRVDGASPLAIAAPAQYLAVHTGLGYPSGNRAYRAGFRRARSTIPAAPHQGWTIMDAKSGANIKTAKLTVGDQTWSFPVYDGTIGPEVIDVSKLYAETGRFTYDPGFTSTGSCESKITYIDGDEGILLYRGYPIEALAEHAH